MRAPLGRWCKHRARGESKQATQCAGAGRQALEQRHAAACPGAALTSSSTSASSSSASLASMSGSTKSMMLCPCHNCACRGAERGARNGWLDTVEGWDESCEATGGLAPPAHLSSLAAPSLQPCSPCPSQQPCCPISAALLPLPISDGCGCGGVPRISAGAAQYQHPEPGQH